MILGLVDEAVASGARQEKACALLNIEPRTLQRWRGQDIGDDGRAGPKHPPANKLTAQERARVLEIANAPENRDLSPQQIVCRLATQGEYVASESTFSRVLREEKQMGHREPSQPPKKRHRPEEYVATGPNQVWSWDITYLRLPVRGMFLYFYVVVDSCGVLRNVEFLPRTQAGPRFHLPQLHIWEERQSASSHPRMVVSDCHATRAESAPTIGPARSSAARLASTSMTT